MESAYVPLIIRYLFTFLMIWHQSGIWRNAGGTSRQLYNSNLVIYLRWRLLIHAAQLQHRLGKSEDRGQVDISKSRDFVWFTSYNLDERNIHICFRFSVISDDMFMKHKNSHVIATCAWWYISDDKMNLLIIVLVDNESRIHNTC